jgi:ATP-dependent Clp protease adaptor protein ClpS
MPFSGLWVGLLAQAPVVSIERPGRRRFGAVKLEKPAAACPFLQHARVLIRVTIDPDAATGPTGYTDFMPSRPKPPAQPPQVGKPDDGQGSVVAERKAARTRPPRMFQVVMLNDDFTPMEFVVMVLQEYFRLDREAATQVMLRIHHEGRAVCGVFTKDVAATKVELVLAAARRSGHPLQCMMEAA